MRRLLAFCRGAFARFLGIGSINTAIDVGVFTMLSVMGLPVLAANAISTLCGLIFSFSMNRRFTFGRRGRTSAVEVAAFVLVTGVGLWIIQPLILLGAERAAPHSAAALGTGKLVAVAVGIVWNWVWYSRVLYRTSAAAAAAAVSTAVLVEGPAPSLDAVR